MKFFRREKAAEEPESKPLPPLPAGVFDLPPSDIDYDRMDWERDVKRKVDYDLRCILGQIVTERDEAQIRFLQGQAFQLMEILQLPAKEKYLSQKRGERIREEMERHADRNRR